MFHHKNFELVSDRMKRIIKRNELYKKEMLLYKKLCEELIKLSDVSDLDKISSIVNDTISFPKANEIFLNEIKDKHIVTSNEFYSFMLKHSQNINECHDLSNYLELNKVKDLHS